MRQLILALACTALLNAQTEVRRGVVLPSYKDLKFPALPPLKVPEPTEVTLSNGMKVFMLENHELPLISGTALIRTGNLFDPADKKGLAGITGEVLRSGGTHTKTGDQIDADLENIAASVESSIGESAGTLSFDCLKENSDQVLRVFHDFITAPEFRQDKVDLAKTQSRSEISRRNDDAHGIAEREFASILYGRDNSYGWEIEYSDIDHIQRQDLINFYKRYYFPSNILLEIYGDFSTADMKGKLEQIFGDWKVTQPPVPAFPAVTAKPAPGVYLADKEDVTQSFIDVGHLGGELKDKDYPALVVAAEILGGGFSSRLFEDIRTTHGWAYSIGASWGANYDHPGTFHISGSTQSAHTVDTIKAIRDEVDRMRTGEVTDEELENAKNTVLNGFIFNFDRPSKTLNRLMQYEYYGYPRDFIFQYQKAIGTVTKADVLRVAKEHFRPQDFTYVAVGNPKAFGTPLTALSLKITPIDLTIPEPKTEAAKVDGQSLARGKALLLTVQKALGGADKLAAVKDLQYAANVEVQTPGGPNGPIGMKVKQTNSFLLPSTMRQEIEMPFGKQVVYSDGSAGWLAGMGGARNLPPPVLAQVRGEVFRLLAGLALSDRDPNRTINYAGDGVLEISSKSGESARLKVDEGTGMPLTLSYREGTAAVEDQYADWRDVAGLHLPFQLTVSQDGHKYADLKIDEYKINSGLTQDALSKKP